MERLTPHTRLQTTALKLKGSSCIGLLLVTLVHLHLTLLSRELHSIPATQEWSPLMSTQRLCHMLDWILSHHMLASDNSL